MKAVVFRVKGGNTYGWGHVVRMTTLAAFMKDKFDDLEINFVVEGERKVSKYIQKSGFAACEIPFNLNIRKEKLWWRTKDSVELMVVDLLGLENSRVKVLREKCRKLAVFSDMGKKYPLADILIYPQAVGTSSDEKKAGRTILRGPKYFVLNNDFFLLHGKPKEIPSQAKNIFVCLGGSTNAAAILKIAQAILLIQDIFKEVDFVVGYGSDLGLLKILKKTLPKANIIEATDKVPLLLSRADIAIVAGGFIKYELAAVGTPGIIVSLVKHQHELAVKFSSTMAAEYIGRISELKTENISNAVARLAQDFKRRKQMSLAGKRLVDGLATERLAPFLVN